MRRAVWLLHFNAFGLHLILDGDLGAGFQVPFDLGLLVDGDLPFLLVLLDNNHVPFDFKDRASDLVGARLGGEGVAGKAENQGGEGKTFYEVTSLGMVAARRGRLYLRRLAADGGGVKSRGVGRFG